MAIGDCRQMMQRLQCCSVFAAMSQQKEAARGYRWSLHKDADSVPISGLEAADFCDTQEHAAASGFDDRHRHLCCLATLCLSATGGA